MKFRVQRGQQVQAKRRKPKLQLIVGRQSDAPVEAVQHESTGDFVLCQPCKGKGTVKDSAGKEVTCSTCGGTGLVRE